MFVVTSVERETLSLEIVVPVIECALFFSQYLMIRYKMHYHYLMPTLLQTCINDPIAKTCF